MAKTDFEVEKDKLQVRLTHVFKATPERLWRAHTKPEEIVQWWADTVVDKFDLRVGGEWRFVSNGQHGFRGVFKELDEPRQITRTFEYEPMAGHIMTETVTFEPQSDGTTKQVTVSTYANLDDLNGMVGMGMEEGAKDGLERLAKLVEAEA